MLSLHDNYKNNDDLITQNLQTQNEKLMEKIKERRERSFSRSISKLGIPNQSSEPKGQESDKNPATDASSAIKGKPIFKSGIGSKRGDKCNILGDDFHEEVDDEAEEPFTGQFLTENILSMINAPEDTQNDPANELQQAQGNEYPADGTGLRKGPKPV